MQFNQKFIILGGGFAGVSAALRLANRTRRKPVQITLVNASATFVERTRLHQTASGQQVATKSFDELLASTKIAFVLGKVTTLDPTQKTITVNTDASVQTLDYDKLIYALGSHTDLTRIPGVAEHAYAVEQHAAFTEQLHKITPNHGRVLVIGGGLTGIEIATELAETHPALSVALATTGALSDNMSSAGATHLYKIFQNLGITLHEQTEITRLEAGQAMTADGTLPFDLCIYAAGFRCAPLAQRAGLTVNAKNQIVVNACLHAVSHPDIYAVGDAAALSVRMGCVTAIPLGIHAAENLARGLTGQPEQPFGFGFIIRCISLGRRNGLVQFTDAEDRPRARILSGRAAVVIKELILHYVMQTLQFERRFAFYRWPQTRVAHPTVATTSTPSPNEALVTEMGNR